VLGFYSSADFIELGARFGVGEHEAYASIGMFSVRAERVEAEVKASLLSPSAKKRYLASFRDRLKAISI